MTVADVSTTPMMAQYLQIKAEHPEALLFYRMGDFYELFFEDAAAAAEALDIALTKRGKHQGHDIAMCGVPVHSSESYLLTLIRKGFRVAVCEQMEDPAAARARGAKAVVRREVVRLVTPGTLTEDSLLEARRHNYLAAYAEVREEAALAWVDISTGAFRVSATMPVRLAPELARLGPREVLVAEEREADLAPIVAEAGATPTPMAAASFDSLAAESRLTALFRVETLEGFGRFTRAELAAMGAVAAYLELTQKGSLPRLATPVREVAYCAVRIDTATRRNLELTESLSGGRTGTLIAAVDRTMTGPGARLLEARIAGPSRDLDEIRARHAALGCLHADTDLCDGLRAALRRCPDMDRALSRITLERAGPRDLAAIRTGLAQAEAIAERLAGIAAPARLMEAAATLTGFDAPRARLDDALVAEPPALTRDGGLIAAGYDAELDEARRLRDEGRGVIAGMQAELAEETGIGALKIRHNNVLGYFVEVPATHGDRMLSAPLNERFIHRQTTANALRFTTRELSELETRILHAGGRALEIERRIFGELAGAITEAAAEIGTAAAALAEIDVAAGLADLARAEDWVAPVLDESRTFQVEGGRHPVVEAALRPRGGAPFIANDCALAADEPGAAIWLVTGPNMAGKSTFLRQNALIALLAQAGAWVPARRAHIGLVSALFSRVGAADDLARGRSTFMVEMVETATILNQADDRALVILDEIGRGTATYDGLSIAWATLEHLHDVNACRALFATHYHELTSLTEKLPGVATATVAVREWEGEVVFLHEVQPGAADRSYGVQVARLAGLPERVVDRARTVLEALEASGRETGRTETLVDDLPLFSAAPSRPQQSAPSPLEARLAELQPDELSPRAALELLYELKRTADSQA